MFGRAKNMPAVPSEAQARDKLVIYVYEYLTHMGAKNAAESFLSEINWSKGPITSNDPPGFLYAWWCVFWDLYCAAPERRENPQFQSAASKEAVSFHDYQAGGPPGNFGQLSPNQNGMAMPPMPPHHSQPMGDVGPGLAPSPQLGAPGNDGPMPPGFFPGPPHLRSGGPMMPHGGMMHPPGGMHGGQGQGPPPGQSPHPNQGQPPPGHMSNGPGNPNSPHPGMGMMMQGPGNVPFMGPRGPFPGGPGSNRSSPGARMGHPGPQQMEFGPPPGAIMMNDGSMVMGRPGMNRGPMSNSPMPMPPGGGGYVGQGPPGMQRMQHPGGNSPQNSVLLPSMHQQHPQRQPWQHPGAIGQYSTPSSPNGGYMGMMGPPSHMQSPSHDSVISGGSDNMYGMMKGPDRFGHGMNDPGEGMDMKHSPGMNGVEGPGGRNNPSNMENDDPYSINQFSAAAAAGGTSSD